MQGAMALARDLEDELETPPRFELDSTRRL